VTFLDLTSSLPEVGYSLPSAQTCIVVVLDS